MSCCQGHDRVPRDRKAHDEGAYSVGSKIKRCSVPLLDWRGTRKLNVDVPFLRAGSQWLLRRVSIRCCRFHLHKEHRLVLALRLTTTFTPLKFWPKSIRLQVCVFLTLA